MRWPRLTLRQPKRPVRGRGPRHHDDRHLCQGRNGQGVSYGGKTVTIHGIAKGSGMIAPDMATMLVFLFTDAAVPAKLLQNLLSQSVTTTFNCITVDGDTSTSDTVLLFATGAAGPHPRD